MYEVSHILVCLFNLIINGANGITTISSIHRQGVSINKVSASTICFFIILIVIIIHGDLRPALSCDDDLAS